MNEFVPRAKGMARKFQFCAYDPNDHTLANFSNSKAKVAESIELQNKALLSNGLLPMVVMKCAEVLKII